MTKFSVSLLALLTIGLSATPAWAHDELVSTSPQSGATVEAGPIPITLQFSEAPMDLPFGQGNLIAIADAKTGEQIGPACATVSENKLSTVVKIASAGEYKVLWRVASDDGHINSGEFNITVENNSFYTTDNPGNQCFDENGNELDITTQELLSVKQEQTDYMYEGIVWAAAFVVLGALIASFLVKRRQGN